MKAVVLSSVLVASACVARPAVAVDSFTVDIVRTDGGGALGWNGSLTYEIRGILTDQSNDGLAFFTYDLQVVGPSSINLSAAIVQSGGPAMSTFEQPLGYSVDFNGTPVGNELHQAGGAQNVIDNDPNASPFVAFPRGEPVGNVGHGAGVVLHQGTFTIPAGTSDGPYTLQIIANSLIGKVLEVPLAAGPDPVIAVDANIGASLTFSVLKDVVAPVLLHQPAEGPQGVPCTGYIDPRFDSSNGIDVDLCFTAWDSSAYIPEEIVMVFSEQVRNGGAGGGTALTTAAFTVAVTGGVAPGVASVNDVMVGNDHVVTITLDGPIPVQEWTTITAGVEDLAGNAIASSGNEGPGVVESDRIDIGCLPGDVNQSGNTSPFDLIRLKQKILGTCSGEDDCPECSGLLLGYDIDRKGSFSTLDLVFMKQLMLNSGNSTRVWNGQLMNSVQP